MPPEDEIKIPIDTNDPAQFHGQVMFALGQLLAQAKALSDYQRIANGRTGKIEERVGIIEKWQATDDGKNTEVQLTWSKIVAFLTVIIAATALLLKLFK